MKKLLALIALILIIVGIGYGYALLTNDYSILILFGMLVAMIACIALIGAIFWLFDYIAKN